MLFLGHEEGRSPCQGLHGDLGFSGCSLPGRRVWVSTVSAAKASRDDWTGSQSEQQNRKGTLRSPISYPCSCHYHLFLLLGVTCTKRTKGLKVMTRS